MGIFDIFKGENKNEKELVVLANDIHKKFHATCDVLEKVKTNISKADLIKQLNLKNVSEEKYSTNLREIDLDIGNGHIFSKIENEDHSMSNFQKYRFSITGIQDYAGLSLIFNYKEKKRQIVILDIQELLGGMSSRANQASLDNKKLTEDGKKLYELILAKGKFKK
jgi:hypothetical protein